MAATIRPQCRAYLDLASKGEGPQSKHAEFQTEPPSDPAGDSAAETPWLAARLLPLLAIINVTIDIRILVTNYYCY